MNAIPTTSQDHWLNVVKNDDGSKDKTPANAAQTPRTLNAPANVAEPPYQRRAAA